MLVLKERLIISSGHLALVTCFWSTLNRLISNCATVLGLVCYRYASSEVWGLSSIGAHKSSQWTGLMHGWTHSAGELFLAEMTACYQEMHGLSLRLACTCSTPRISLPTSFYKFTFSWQYVRGTCLNKIRNLGTEGWSSVSPQFKWRFCSSPVSSHASSSSSAWRAELP